MKARIIETQITVEDRTFSIYKYPAFVSIKVGKMMASKVLPVFQAFIPVIGELVSAYTGKNGDSGDSFPQTDPGTMTENDDSPEGDEPEISFDVPESAFDPPDDSVINFPVDEAESDAPPVGSEVIDGLLDNIGEYMNLEKISDALDRVSPKELDYIMQMSLMCCYEHLGAGQTQVMNSNGRYCVPNMERDGPLVLRLVCEAVRWGLSDFFTASRLKEILGPLFSLSR